jgi:hypothetical protein
VRATSPFPCSKNGDVCFGKCCPFRPNNLWVLFSQGECPGLRSGCAVGAQAQSSVDRQIEECGKTRKKARLCDTNYLKADWRMQNAEWEFTRIWNAFFPIPKSHSRSLQTNLSAFFSICIQSLVTSSSTMSGGKIAECRIRGGPDRIMRSIAEPNGVVASGAPSSQKNFLRMVFQWRVPWAMEWVRRWRAVWVGTNAQVNFSIFSFK